MPIIVCPECGGKVSTTLSACPHCGYKINIGELQKENNNQEEKEFECIVNIKREHKFVGQSMNWYVYSNGEKLFTLYDNQVVTFTIKELGRYNFIVYHENDSPETHPLNQAFIVPANVDFDVLSTDRNIDIVIALNSGLFKSSLVVKEIKRY